MPRDMETVCRFLKSPTPTRRYEPHLIAMQFFIRRISHCEVTTHRTQPGSRRLTGQPTTCPWKFGLLLLPVVCTCSVFNLEMPPCRSNGVLSG